ncbi:hypothetical protein G7K_5393-t1 [Saitoella complicata NRRL Y-17804]|uniref:Uncharacterized protein n=1 Tax=Saitoella complicata (strain BCRC 22490 / CBS 7301 / JCM 7358 / NBRC 10748 / NRRL Y-17804) TaxID=698492 RepID=A0A0E9NNA0_SAICN|nr:hypothetical protein G7K_5393-t1 [Saitoella complicata NRRL Y-17804]
MKRHRDEEYLSSPPSSSFVQQASQLSQDTPSRNESGRTLKRVPRNTASEQQQVYSNTLNMLFSAQRAVAQSQSGQSVEVNAEHCADCGQAVTPEQEGGTLCVKCEKLVCSNA